MSKNEIQKFKEVLDALMVQNALNTIQLSILTDMVLGVYSETLPPENAKKIINRYFDTFIEESRTGLENNENNLFNPMSNFKNLLDFELHLELLKAISLCRVPDSEDD